MAYRIYQFTNAGLDPEDEHLTNVGTLEEVYAWANHEVNDYIEHEKVPLSSFARIGQIPRGDVLHLESPDILFDPPSNPSQPHCYILLHKLGGDCMRWYIYNPFVRDARARALSHSLVRFDLEFPNEAVHGDIFVGARNEHYIVSDRKVEDYDHKHFVHLDNGEVSISISHAIENPVAFYEDYVNDTPIVRKIFLDTVYHRELLSAAAGRGRRIKRAVVWENGVYTLQPDKKHPAPTVLDENTPDAEL